MPSPGLSYKLTLFPVQLQGDFTFPRNQRRYRVISLQVAVNSPGDDLTLLQHLAGDQTVLLNFSATCFEAQLINVLFAHGLTERLAVGGNQFEYIPIPFDWWVEPGQTIRLAGNTQNQQFGPIALTYEEGH